MSIEEMKQSRTGVTLPYYFAGAGSWRKQIRIFA
jgi:hypothetical protein